VERFVLPAETPADFRLTVRFTECVSMRCQIAASTMSDVLAQQAADDPTRTAYVFLDDRDGAVEMTYGELDRRARVIAARLQLELQPGDRALLVYPPGLDFIAAFFGCLYAGVVAVPATYPKPRRPMPRLNRIAVDCDAHVALSTAATLTTLDPELLSADAATSQWIATDELVDELAAHFEPAAVRETDLAFLQYTSGSTSDPKGVMVSHANLLNNLECIRQAFGIGEMEQDHLSATGVFWLPAYHDMGLIGGVLTPLYMGGRSVLMSPTAFLQRPLRWLEAIHQYEATISGAPNFAYDFVARRTKPEERAKLDLSMWRLAFCGAEPIRAETFALFAEAVRPCGFQSKSLYPCYGLAEATLLAAGPDFHREPTVLVVNRQALSEHRVAVAVASEPEEMTRRLVGCGQAMPDHTLVLVDPATNSVCGPDQVGEILIQGPSVAAGYWNRAEETADEFGARVPGHEGRFLRTGDLGFIHDGELYVTGRLKDVIIIRGRNHYPQDVEQSAEAAHPALLMGAAFALENEGGERLVIVNQVDRQFRDANWDQVVQAIRRAVVEHHEIDPYAVVLIRQTSLPITSSGKVQRTLCRQQYEAGELRVVHSWTNPAATGAATNQTGQTVRLGGEGVSWSRPQQKGSARRRRPAGSVELDRATERIEAWMLDWLMTRLGLTPEDVSRDRPFAEYGVDSLTAVELSHELEQQFSVPLPPIVAWNYPTPAALARFLAEETLGVKRDEPAESMRAANGTNGAEEDDLAALLAEVENLSDAEAARLLGEEQRQA
jgi:acyl-CoA synthetase (AMP-forming)/AMP-acid ligase II/acyl carrier protein